LSAPSASHGRSSTAAKQRRDIRAKRKNTNAPGSKTSRPPMREITKKEMKQVEGGADNLNSSKSNLIQPETGYVTKPIDNMSPKFR
jgi:bacteriocin-like protein